MKLVLPCVALAVLSASAVCAQPAITLGSIELLATRGDGEESIPIEYEGASADTPAFDIGTFTRNDELVVTDPFLIASAPANSSRVTGARLIYAARIRGTALTLATDTVPFTLGSICDSGVWRPELAPCSPGDEEWGLPELRTDLPLSLGNGALELEVKWQIDTEVDGQATPSTTSTPVLIFLTLEDPLPVELTDFTATASGAGVELAWSTATEANNRGFGVERSPDAESWNEVAFVAGAGDSRTSIAYSVTDEVKPGSNTLYYRLRQEDYDRTTSYSAIEVVEPTERPGPSFSILPNFARENTTLTNLSETHREVELIDGSGRRVRNFKLLAGESVNVDVDQLPAGIYSLVSGGVTKSLLVQ